MLTFRIQKNTDGVDVHQECLGLDAWVIGDSVNDLNVNRGLHIQIRHNRDGPTKAAAFELQPLIAAAPKMFETLQRIAKNTDVIEGILARNLLSELGLANG